MARLEAPAPGEEGETLGLRVEGKGRPGRRRPSESGTGPSGPQLRGSRNEIWVPCGRSKRAEGRPGKAERTSPPWSPSRRPAGPGVAHGRASPAIAAPAQLRPGNGGQPAPPATRGIPPRARSPGPRPDGPTHHRDMAARATAAAERGARIAALGAAGSGTAGGRGRGTGQGQGRAGAGRGGGPAAPPPRLSVSPRQEEGPAG